MVTSLSQTDVRARIQSANFVAQEAAIQCQYLVELGVPLSDAQNIAHVMAQSIEMRQATARRASLQVRELLPTYWRRLIEVDVPIDIARKIAEPIAHYVVTGLPIPDAQKRLIARYCVYVCRAGLWQPGLLLS